MSWLTGLGVALATAALDVAWAYYVHGVASQRYWAAGVSVAVIPLLSGGATISVVHEPLYLVPAAIGGVLGTLGTMKWGVR